VDLFIRHAGRRAGLGFRSPPSTTPARASGHNWKVLNRAISTSVPASALCRRVASCRRPQAGVPVASWPSVAQADARLSQPDPGAAQTPPSGSFVQLRPGLGLGRPRSLADREPAEVWLRNNDDAAGLGPVLRALCDRRILARRRPLVASECNPLGDHGATLGRPNQDPRMEEDRCHSTEA